uniref:Variant surface glycoprotein 1125.60 n=1 Tax=Trypanosoma brucei TaxID=5691 RepID=M4TDP1_9TRYP|nr:variant surface glycoprotein 629 [Trypanosoma brucei]APD72606.1 variant surface glycoprotein 1125.60 [Trypanosoma brucei]
MTTLHKLFFLVGALCVVRPATATQEALTAAGLVDACRLASQLKKLGAYSAAMANRLPTKIEQLRAKVFQITMMLAQEKKGPAEADLNVLYYLKKQIQTAEKTVIAQLQLAVKKGLKAAEAAGRIDETVHLLANANTGSGNEAYCVAKATATAEAATKTEMQECYDGEVPRSAEPKVEVLEEPDLNSARAAINQNQGTAKNPKASASCLLSSTANTNGFLANGGGTHGTIKLMGGILKIDGSAWTAANWLDAKASVGDGYPLSELHKLLTADTKTLKAALDGITELAKLGDADEANLQQIEASRDELGMSGQGDPIIIKSTDFDSVSKRLKAFLSSESSNLADLQKTFDRKILKKALTPEANTERCSSKSIEKEDICSKITDKNECNSKSFCSYSETETDTNKKCEFNETKASKSGVPVPQTQTGGRQTTEEKCKGKKKDDCKDGCKWEGETCKDSSFLLTKKFALSVVSATFVALLF